MHWTAASPFDVVTDIRCCKWSPGLGFVSTPVGILLTLPFVCGGLDPPRKREDYGDCSSLWNAVGNLRANAAAAWAADLSIGDNTTCPMRGLRMDSPTAGWQVQWPFIKILGPLLMHWHRRAVQSDTVLSVTGSLSVLCSVTHWYYARFIWTDHQHSLPYVILETFSFLIPKIVGKIPMWSLPVGS